MKMMLGGNYEDILEKSQISRISQVSNRHRNINPQGEVIFTASDDKRLNMNYVVTATTPVDVELALAPQNRKRTQSGLSAIIARKSPYPSDKDQLNRS